MSGSRYQTAFSKRKTLLANGQAVLKAMLSANRLTIRESLWALAASMAGVWALFGSYALQGAIFSDQWAQLATQRFLMSGGLVARVQACFEPETLASLPGGCVLGNVIYASFGEHGRLYSSTALAAFGLILALFYMVLRLAGLAPLWSAGAVALTATLQSADALRLWPMLGAEAMLLSFLTGLLLAAAAARTSSPARLWALGAGAVLLLAGASTFYQTIGPVTPLAIGYIWVIGRKWGRSLAIGGLATAAAAIVGYFRATSSGRIADRSGGQTVDHALAVVKGTVDAWTESFLRFPAPAWWAVGIVSFAAVSATCLSWSMPSCRQSLRSAWGALTFGVPAAFLGTAAFFPTDGYYVPRTYGLDNRMLVVAQFGYVLVAVALFIFIGLLGAAVLERPNAGVALSIGLITISAATAIPHSFRSRDLWTQSWKKQLDVLGAINDTVPRVRPHEAILTFGHPLYEVNWLPVFAQPWELDSAIKVARGNPTANGYPASGWGCTIGGISRTDAEGRPAKAPAFAFEDVVFVNVELREAFRPQDLAACAETMREWGANPVF